MESWLQADLTVNGLRLRYYRSGGEKPPLVLVHGFTDNALYWTRAALALAHDWDVIAYDARGHGQSSRAGGRFDDAVRVADLLAVIESLGLKQPALVGHSMGAAAIALAAAENPALARCLVLEDPAWREPDDSEAPAVSAASLAAWRAWVEGLQAGSREFGRAQIRAHSPHWSDQDQALSLNARLQFEPALFEHYPRAAMPWRPVAARIACPTLLLLGDAAQRGPIVTEAMAREAAAHWQRSRWVVVRGAGHSIRYDQFNAYLDEVQTFLRRVLAGD